MKQFTENLQPEHFECRVDRGQNSFNADTLSEACISGRQPDVTLSLQPVSPLGEPAGYVLRLPDVPILGRPLNMPHSSCMDGREYLVYSLLVKEKPGHGFTSTILKWLKVHSYCRINLFGSRVLCPKNVLHKMDTVGLCPERGWKLPPGGSERTARDGIIILAGSFEIRNTFWPVSYHATSEFAAKISFSKPRLNQVNTMFTAVTGEYAMIKTTGFF